MLCLVALDLEESQGDVSGPFLSYTHCSSTAWYCLDPGLLSETRSLLGLSPGQKGHTPGTAEFL